MECGNKPLDSRSFGSSTGAMTLPEERTVSWMVLGQLNGHVQNNDVGIQTAQCIEEIIENASLT